MFTNPLVASSVQAIFPSQALGRAGKYRDGPYRRDLWQFSFPDRLGVIMAEFSIGDHVGWNSEAGRVSGRIVKVHHEDFDYKGHRHRASKADPQYEIKSDKTDHIAAHKGRALTKID